MTIFIWTSSPELILQSQSTHMYVYKSRHLLIKKSLNATANRPTVKLPSNPSSWTFRTKHPQIPAHNRAIKKTICSDKAHLQRLTSQIPSGGYLSRRAQTACTQLKTASN